QRRRAEAADRQVGRRALDLQKLQRARADVDADVAAFTAEKAAEARREDLRKRECQDVPLPTNPAPTQFRAQGRGNLGSPHDSLSGVISTCAKAAANESPDTDSFFDSQFDFSRPLRLGLAGDPMLASGRWFGSPCSRAD